MYSPGNKRHHPHTHLLFAFSSVNLTLACRSRMFFKSTVGQSVVQGTYCPTYITYKLDCAVVSCLCKCTVAQSQRLPEQVLRPPTRSCHGPAPDLGQNEGTLCKLISAKVGTSFLCPVFVKPLAAALPFGEPWWYTEGPIPELLTSSLFIIRTCSTTSRRQSRDDGKGGVNVIPSRNRTQKSGSRSSLKHVTGTSVSAEGIWCGRHDVVSTQERITHFQPTAPPICQLLVDWCSRRCGQHEHDLRSCCSQGETPDWANHVFEDLATFLKLLIGRSQRLESFKF